MNRKPSGFTLLELIIVIIIIGILAVLGLTQYTTILEKGRAGEARANLGAMRKFAYDYYLKNSIYTDVTGADLGIYSGGLPSSCSSTHLFRYGFDSATHTPQLVLVATRCTSGGKDPQGPSAYIIYTTTSATTGISSTFGCSGAGWSGSCNY